MRPFLIHVVNIVLENGCFNNNSKVLHVIIITRETLQVLIRRTVTTRARLIGLLVSVSNEIVPIMFFIRRRY
jgi:hypothetical protein